MKKIILFTFTAFLSLFSIVYGQENKQNFRFGVYGGAIPYRLSTVLINVGGTIERPIMRNNNVYWSSSLNYSNRLFSSISLRESISLCTGYSKVIYRKTDKVELLIGGQIGYLYEDWFKTSLNRFFINAAFLRISGELCFPIKSFDLGIISHFGMGFGYRNYVLVHPLRINGNVIPSAFGTGIILKYTLK